MTAGVSLFAMLLAAPLVGVRRRWPDVLHAVPLENVPMSEKASTCVAACGVRHVKLLHTKEVSLFPWPPQHRLPAPMVRCRECWLKTGKKSPRVTIGVKP